MIFFAQHYSAQISPGDLTKFHAELEGLSNCTQCHDLGKNVSKAKCMTCHTEITDLMNENRGYHSDVEVISKDCWSCHGEHFGRNFDIIRFDEDKFDHKKSGFELNASHEKLNCNKCHKTDFISNTEFKSKQKTFLGLNSNCKTCHEDVHQQTLNSNCKDCHSEDKFLPASKFSHENTNFKLTGSHSEVDCIKCHQKEKRNNKSFQKFANVKFSSCDDCHTDVHTGKFGNDCKSCHTDDSFKNVNISDGFNHSKTNFPLLGKHNFVKCDNCHKNNFSDKPKYKKCYDCHEDYHKADFIKNNIRTDCRECHTEQSFSPSTFTIEKHEKTNFKLSYAHSATPCNACHLTEGKWSFRIESDRCISCHQNIHGDEISKKYFDENKCETCHSTRSWKYVEFDHNKTKFELVGKHKSVSCSNCHIIKKENIIIRQKFSQLKQNCTQCHQDIHFGQFVENEKELCKDCHTNDNWNPTLFNHNKSRFTLDGAHNKLDCGKCHKEIMKGELKYINYKIEDVTCKSCHS